MSNLTDALIAAKLVGGSGGSGGGSGLPEIKNVETELFNGAIDFSGSSAEFYIGQGPADFTYEAGKTYTISWDNTTYTCAGRVFQGAGVAVGNLSIMGMGEDTGEPFLSFTQSGAVTFLTRSTAATHNVVVVGFAQSPSDSTALVVVNGEWSLQSGYAFEDNGVITPFSPDFLPTSMYAFEYTTTSENVINAYTHGNYLIRTSAFDSFTESNRTYPVVIYGINIKPRSGIADFDFAVPYAFYWSGAISVGINNVKNTILTIPSGSKISGVLLIPKVIQLT